MKNNAIYFPYIKVPNSNWLVKTLLYWNEFSTIVPYEQVDNFLNSSNIMKDLNKSQLVKIINPAQFSNTDNMKMFFEKFLMFATNWKRRNPTYKGKYSEIHIEKLGYIFDDLIKEKIIFQGRSNAWYKMPTILSNVFMNGLANGLGSLTEINAEPVTDILYENKVKIETISRNYNVRFWQNKLLEDVLPVPNRETTIDEIINFRKKYHTQTIEFRDIINENAKALSKINTDNPEEIIANYSKYLNNIKEKEKEIEDGMKSSFSSITKNSITFLSSTGLGVKQFLEGNTDFSATIPISVVALHDVYDNVKDLLKKRKSAYNFSIALKNL